MIPWSIIILVTLIGVGFKYYQDRGKMGGSIAWSKCFWLNYTIINWFLLPLYFWYSDIGPLKYTLMTIASMMWIRGIIELYMLFVTKNWKPMYGIIHNVMTILAAFVVFYFNPRISMLESIYTLSLFISLNLEIYYATFFHEHVGEKTQGDKAVWFASKDDPKFKQVLTVTTLGNLYVYGSLFYFLLN
jgi:hypothetical protein